jgi:hypothetical protein
MRVGLMKRVRAYSARRLMCARQDSAVFTIPPCDVFVVVVEKWLAVYF